MGNLDNALDNGNWSLDELYPGFSSEKFKNDFANSKNEIDFLLKWTKDNFTKLDNPQNKLEEFINKYNELGLVLSLMAEYCQLVLSTDAENGEAIKYLGKIEDMIADLAPADTLFTEFVNKIPNLDEIIEGSSILKEHKFFLQEQKAKGKYLLSEKEEVAISQMKKTGSLSWMKLWDVLSSTLKVEVDSKIYPLPAVRNMAYDKDQNVRKTAYFAELKALESIAQSSAAAMNGIKGEVITTCKMRGYASPLDMTLLDSRMDKKVLDAMISTMKEYQPVFRKYLRKKAEVLGDKNGLPFYDLFAPVGSADMKYTYEEAQEFVISNFSSFHPELGAFAKNAFEKHWIDVYPKDGKRGGAFCSNLQAIKESRILTNFSGSFNDVITLSHELGHGFHGECLKNETSINSDYPMPIAETASTFCETLVKNAALKTATNEEKIAILESDISDDVQICVDILCRFLFEDEVFRRRAEGPLSVEELNEIMLDAQRQTYGDGLDPEFMHKYMWVVKPHYYDVDYNYYNFPYAFGLLFAKGLYSIYLEKGEAFFPDYKKILASAGKNSHKDIALMAGIDITKEEFWRGSLELIKKEVEDYISLL